MSIGTIGTGAAPARHCSLVAHGDLQAMKHRPHDTSLPSRWSSGVARGQVRSVNGYLYNSRHGTCRRLFDSWSLKQADYVAGYRF